MTTKRRTKSNHAPAPEGVRLQRLMADGGVASRRDCERMIEEGRVTVNGTRVTRLPVFVDPDNDSIQVDGRPLPRAGRPLYVMLNKPTRTLSTTRDDPTLESQRTTVADLVDHPAKARLFPVGRLEYNASGLVLLTTDGDLAHRLTHPRYGVARTYEALVKRRLTQPDLDQMAAAFGNPRNPDSTPVQLDLIKHDDDRSLISITLREGPNRQVVDVLTRLGCPVKRLRRTAIGPVRLREVALGMWRPLDKTEIAALKRAARGATPDAGATTPRTRRPEARDTPRKAPRNAPPPRAPRTAPPAPAAPRTPQRASEASPSRTPRSAPASRPAPPRPPRAPRSGGSSYPVAPRSRKAPPERRR